MRRLILYPVYRTLKSRIVRNIIFWFLIIVQLVSNVGDQRYYPLSWYYEFSSITLIFLLVLSYGHNLIILPVLLPSRRPFRYILSALLFAFTVSLLYTIALKLIVQNFPFVSISQITLIAVPIHTNWNIAAFLDDVSGYFLAFIVWIFVFGMAWYMNHYKTQEKKIQQVQQQQVEIELTFLKAQINPHFLFNNLNNLYALAIKKSDHTPDAILKLSALLRYLLYESNAELIFFEKEKEVMLAYIDLELLRFSDLDHVHFSVDADKEGYLVPPLLWLAVLENVFKHGLRIISDQVSVTFSFTISNNEVRIYSRNFYKRSNMGNGRNELSGIGLTNLRKRLELLYTGRYQYHISQDQEDYIVDIKIQLN